MIGKLRSTGVKAALLLGTGCVVSPLQAQATSPFQLELAALRAEIAALSHRVDELEGESADTAPLPQSSTAAAAPTSPATPAIAFKGAPEISLGGGWTFKPRGRLMVDAGTVDAPRGTGGDGGFGSEVRRARLGVQGAMPAGFGYKFEADFAGNAVEVADAVLTWSDGPVEVAVGQHNNFQSLEELTSSLHSSFIERAAFTDAFAFQRRIGISASYERGIVLAQAGAFTDNLEETGTDNRGVDGRLVLMPQTGLGQLHLGASLHYADIGTPGSTLRYRQRPLVHFTSDRFIDTGALGASHETGYGLEAALVSGRFHAAAEAFWQNVGRPGAVRDPTFFGGYAEIGYFISRGDRRGYSGGQFDRVRPARPLGEGGWGSLQFNLRYDHLDLTDGGIVGGTQDGYYASLVWKPIDHVLFMINYGHLDYADAAIATPTGARDYGVDVVGMRAQIDF